MLNHCLIKRLAIGCCLLVLVYGATLSYVTASGWAPRWPIGTQFMPITLPDPTGIAQDISTLSGPNGLALVFIRSVVW